MIKLTEEFVDQAAPNQNAIMNGRGLVRKKSFVRLNISGDETLIFGECKGSGASNYRPSADFANPENPIYRCSCPSRQFPCKHVLGLMYAFVEGNEFITDEIPQDITDKREKAEKREEKKKSADSEKPKKVNKNAMAKKIQAQKEGLELLEKITNNIVQSGLGTINSKTLKLLDAQVKQLGNYYIPGAQNALREFLVLFKDKEDNEKIYTEAVDCLITLHSLCKKGSEYLNKRLENFESPLDTESAMEEWLGHAWQLSELKDLGLVQNDSELVQLAFNSYFSEARQEYIDCGTWLNLNSSQVVESRNYRPIKAAKYIREDDSFYSVLKTPELFVYPGDMNPRVRWENMSVREVRSSDYKLIKSYAQKSCKEAVKQVKNQIKNPLSAKYPAVLLEFSRIAAVNGSYVLEDSAGQRIVLLDNPRGFEPPTVSLLRLLPKDSLNSQAALVRFHNDMDAKRLYAQPLSVITDSIIIRLTY